MGRRGSSRGPPNTESYSLGLQAGHLLMGYGLALTCQPADQPGAVGPGKAAPGSPAAAVAAAEPVMASAVFETELVVSHGSSAAAVVGVGVTAAAWRIAVAAAAGKVLTEVAWSAVAQT